MHSRSTKRNRGLTLVELLVVLGIIVILATVTVPMLGMFYKNRTDLMARELFTLIRAAQMYATTHNVHAGIGFGFSMRTDSLSGSRLQSSTRTSSRGRSSGRSLSGWASPIQARG